MRVKGTASKSVHRVTTVTLSNQCGDHDRPSLSDVKITITPVVGFLRNSE